ncbi:MAG: putative nucleotidyltransferase substrate binding domain-containing protein [Desulfuromonadaceae bacterium]|nr:putative nucleotidyltransferase substrate binding domain-containing protein [Desulfuromonadaceae bacterium]MDD2856032.1 putative nucleotidyltransferase substrate binding domain-containing protein [Desulfuromonadaceae bacterium]
MAKKMARDKVGVSLKLPVIYADDLSDDEINLLENFSDILVKSLIDIGVHECPGGIMASKPFWRRSLTEWMNMVDEWTEEPSSENILHFCMFCDLRTIAGDPAMEKLIKAHIAKRAEHNTLFLTQLAVQSCKFSPPLGFFGGFKVEKSGDHRGEIDLKTAGIFAITEGIRVLGLSVGIVGGGTEIKMIQLKEKGVLSSNQLENLLAGFNILCDLRMLGQLESITNGGNLSNHISPDMLNRVDQGRLHTSLEIVRSFEEFIASRFRLDIAPG